MKRAAHHQTSTVMLSRYLLTASFLLIFRMSHAQEFHLVNDAALMPNGCVQLTPNVPYAEGIAYCKTKLDLSKHFEIELDIYLGKDDAGADGITFVLQNDPRGFEAFGTWGECMGYGTWSRDYPGGTYIAPSVAVEFDTYYNPRQNDPPSDHVAYVENGSSTHNKYWNGNNDNFNMEDDMLHTFRFRWNPERKRITIYLDGTIVFEGVRDLRRDIFNGETKVIWGFTASTGRKSNLQYFCLKRIVQRLPRPLKDYSQQAQSRRTN